MTMENDDKKFIQDTVDKAVSSGVDKLKQFTDRILEEETKINHQYTKDVVEDSNDKLKKYVDESLLKTQDATTKRVKQDNEKIKQDTKRETTELVSKQNHQQTQTLATRLKEIENLNKAGMATMAEKVELLKGFVNRTVESVSFQSNKSIACGISKTNGGTEQIASGVKNLFTGNLFGGITNVLTGTLNTGIGAAQAVVGGGAAAADMLKAALDKESTDTNESSILTEYTVTDKNKNNYTEPDKMPSVTPSTQSKTKKRKTKSQKIKNVSQKEVKKPNIKTTHKTIPIKKETTVSKQKAKQNLIQLTIPKTDTKKVLESKKQLPKILPKKSGSQETTKSILKNGLGGLSKTLNKVSGFLDIVASKQKLIVGGVLAGTAGILALMGWVKEGGLEQSLKKTFGTSAKIENSKKVQAARGALDSQVATTAYMKQDASAIEKDLKATKAVASNFSNQKQESLTDLINSGEVDKALSTEAQSYLELEPGAAVDARMPGSKTQIQTRKMTNDAGLIFKLPFDVYIKKIINSTGVKKGTCSLILERKTPLANPTVILADVTDLLQPQGKKISANQPICKMGANFRILGDWQSFVNIKEGKEVDYANYLSQTDDNAIDSYMTDFTTEKKDLMQQQNNDNKKAAQDKVKNEKWHADPVQQEVTKRFGWDEESLEDSNPAIKTSTKPQAEYQTTETKNTKKAKETSDTIQKEVVNNKEELTSSPTTTPMSKQALNPTTVTNQPDVLAEVRQADKLKGPEYGIALNLPTFV